MFCAFILLATIFDVMSSLKRKRLSFRKIVENLDFRKSNGNLGTRVLAEKSHVRKTQLAHIVPNEKEIYNNLNDYHKLTKTDFFYKIELYLPVPFLYIFLNIHTYIHYFNINKLKYNTIYLLSIADEMSVTESVRYSDFIVH